ncbi:dehydrogenase/reductase SDR family member 9 isoform X1 [Danio rerio]|uniref:Dehydrogenase/reductase SDR family member 9 isoform X1 n=1 Tax=Danio rerio TaxID=7955 RepID=A0AC58GD91_DANRE
MKFNLQFTFLFLVSSYFRLCVCVLMSVCLSSRRQMAPFGVKVLCIEPGFFKTIVTDFNIVESTLHRLWNKLPQEVKDEYGSDYVDKTKLTAKELLEKLADGDLMKVVSCMEHAVAAVHPRTRYSPGWDAKFFWLPLSYMPTFISDALLLKKAVQPKASIL